MKIVALETSAQPGQLALVEDTTVVGYERLAASRRTTETYAVVLDRLLKQVGWRPRDVDLFAVSKGPGSFTGLRIGVTAAKVFAYATGCQLMGLSTLELLANQAFVTNGPSASVWAVVDAQRRQCFVAEFKIDSESGRVRSESDVFIVDQPSWFQQLPRRTSVTGCGLVKVSVETLTHLDVSPPETWEPSAIELAGLAARHFEAGIRCDAWGLLPEYGRRSAAEEKHRARRTES